MLGGADRHGLGDVVRKQGAEPGPLQPGDRVVGELLNEQHIGAGPAGDSNQSTINSLLRPTGHAPGRRQSGGQQPRAGA